MKTLITITTAMAATYAMAATSSIPSQTFNGEAILALSPNGKWMVSELDTDNSLAIHNLETGETWRYNYDGTDFGTDYPSAMGPCVSDDGTVVAEVSDIPSYWRNGKWTSLPGYRVNSAGVVAAVVGGITADGSMIAGSMGRGSASMFDDGGMITSPCVWYRQADGTYSEPEWLPTEKDIFGMHPQYLNCTSVSADGNTIAASMRCGTGFWHIPYSYTRGEDGKWTMLRLGEALINPTGMEIMPYPGEYHGPDYPNYEPYMTDDQLYDFYYISGPKWIDDLYAQGITDETMIAILELQYAAEFMDDESKEEYMSLLQPFLDAYLPWYEKYEAYIDFLEKFAASGVDFLFNNGHVSPDGKYVYATASGRGTYPVRFDSKTGEYKEYRGAGMIPTCITDDYSILGWMPMQDADWPTQAYIIPGGEDRAIAIPDYWLRCGLQNNYDWMEEMMYQSVVVSVTASGAEQYDDCWSVGKPIATPDMSLMGFGTSTFYWESHPDEPGNFFTFLLNTGVDTSGIEGVGVDDTASGTSMGSQVEYYTLQGVRTANPGHGIYVKVENGKATKVIL